MIAEIKLGLCNPPEPIHLYGAIRCLVNHGTQSVHN